MPSASYKHEKRREEKDRKAERTTKEEEEKRERRIKVKENKPGYHKQLRWRDDWEGRRDMRKKRPRI